MPGKASGGSSSLVDWETWHVRPRAWRKDQHESRTPFFRQKSIDCYTYTRGVSRLEVASVIGLHPSSSWGCRRWGELCCLSPFPLPHPPIVPLSRGTGCAFAAQPGKVCVLNAPLPMLPGKVSRGESMYLTQPCRLAISQVVVITLWIGQWHRNIGRSLPCRWCVRGTNGVTEPCCAFKQPGQPRSAQHPPERQPKRKPPHRA